MTNYKLQINFKLLALRDFCEMCILNFKFDRAKVRERG